MKSLWTVVSWIVFINMLALVGVLLWLKADGRLDRERIERVVSVFSLRIDEEDAQKQAQAVQDAKAHDAAMEAVRMEQVSTGPVTLAQKLHADRIGEEVAQQRLERLEREQSDLLRQLALARSLLSKERAELDAQRKQFEERVQAEARNREDADFKQAVAMLEQLPSKQAKEMFQQLMRDGQTDRVVSYLAAMQLRKAASVLKEFKQTTEVAQATELIEKLRQRGVDLVASQPPSQTAGNQG
ncbi:MAG: hypothetical protein GC164_05445 [Phycisphaera sp.]|nr:hypothetical protein [Phycisphaera sp.]